MKRSTLLAILILIAAVLLAGCASPADYAAKMAPVLHDFNGWYTGDLEMYHQMLATPSLLDSSETYGDLVMGTVYTYRIGKGVPPSTSWNPTDLELYVNVLTIVHDNAVKLEKEMKSISAPAAISRSHQQIIDCLDYEAAVINSQLEIFTRGTFKDLSYDTDPCKDIQTHYDLLNQYVTKNAGK